MNFTGIIIIVSNTYLDVKKGEKKW